MFKWLFASPNQVAPASKKSSKATIVPVAKLPRRIVAVEAAKGSDQLITISNGTPDLGPYGSGGIIEQYIRRDFGRWFHYPELRKVEYFSEYEKMLEEYHARVAYQDQPVLSLTIKSRKSAVKCVYCHSEIPKKAQVCLQCGGFICLACAPEVSKCPTLGCE